MTASNQAGKDPHRPGRPRIPRNIAEGAVCRCYSPECCPHQDREFVSILPEEIEILRLIDLNGLEQEEAATTLGVSRKTLWRDLQAVREKIADALVHGKGMEVSGCKKRDENLCPKRNRMFCPSRSGPANRADPKETEPGPAESFLPIADRKRSGQRKNK